MTLQTHDDDEGTRRLGRVIAYILSLAREGEAAEADSKASSVLTASGALACEGTLVGDGGKPMPELEAKAAEHDSNG